MTIAKQGIKIREVWHGQRKKTFSRTRSLLSPGWNLIKPRGIYVKRIKTICLRSQAELRKYNGRGTIPKTEQFQETRLGIYVIVPCLLAPCWLLPYYAICIAKAKEKWIYYATNIEATFEKSVNSCQKQGM